MRIELHHYHHFGDTLRIRTMADPEVLEAIKDLKETTMALSAKLQAAVDAARAGVDQANNELEAIAAAFAAQADVAAAAVATALSKVTDDEDLAAQLIDSARVSVQEHIDSVFNRVGVPQPTPVPVMPPETDPAPAADPLELTTTLPAGTVGEAYTSSLGISGGTEPYSVSSSPSGQNGVSVGGAGSVAGTPVEAGDFSFHVEVTDSGSPAQRTSGVATLHVEPAAVVEAPGGGDAGTGDAAQAGQGGPVEAPTEGEADPMGEDGSAAAPDPAAA